MSTECVTATREARLRLRAVDVEHLAHAAGLELEEWLDEGRPPFRKWALVWTDGQGQRRRLHFRNLWDVQAFLLTPRPSAPGPAALTDLVQRAVGRWGDLFATDAPVNGADMCEWMGGWLEDARSLVLREDGPAYPAENHTCPVCSAHAWRREAPASCALVEVIDERGAVTEWEATDITEEDGHIWIERSRQVIDDTGYDGQVALLRTEGAGGADTPGSAPRTCDNRGVATGDR